MVFGRIDGAGSPALVDLVDFKWLMAAQGDWVHLERLQSDRGYALACLRRALGAREATLRRCARRLQLAVSPQGC